MAVITISRQFGAGGRTLCVRLAKKTDYLFLDEIIIYELAKKARVSLDSVRSVERSAGGFISRLLARAVSPGYIDRITGKDIGYMDENIYLDTLAVVMKELAAKDNLIILGRGGQFFLRDLENAYHFLLVADIQDRIGFIRKFYKMTDKEAEKIVADGDARRARLFSKLHKTRYDSPNLYHMVFNMSRLTLDQVVEQIYTLITDRLQDTSSA